MIDRSQVMAEIEAVINAWNGQVPEGTLLSDIPHYKISDFLTRAQALVERFAPHGSVYSRNFPQFLDKKGDLNIWSVPSVQGILVALRSAYRDGQLSMTDAHRETVPAPDHALDSLHPTVRSKCLGLFSKKEYPEAVEKGFKVVRDRLRKLTGYETGSEAFGKGRLHVKGAAAPHVENDFNEAVKFLTMAVDRFRNEKSHTSDAKIKDAIRAEEYLRLSSLAMHLLDDAEVRSG